MPKTDVVYSPPVLNAAGTLGFIPDTHGPVGLSSLGGFVTNPLSLRPRRPASSAGCLAFPGGFLLHTGYPNPGLNRALRLWSPAWARSPLPVLVSLLLHDIGDVARMLEALEGIPGVAGVEINLPSGAEPHDLLAVTQAAFRELAVVVRLPLDQAERMVQGIADDLLEAGLAAVSLGPPRGALVDSQGRLVHGRLYGPALYPQNLTVTHALASAGLPGISAGGVYSHVQVEDLLCVGASAVQLDAALWRNPGLASAF
jgi:dihydroorotate dehydrogenase (NAD+) catalytic subunit